MKRIQQALAPKPSTSPSLLPPADPRQADRASRLAALTNAHYSTSSAGGLPSPHLSAPQASHSHVSGSRRPNTAPQAQGYPTAVEEKRMLEAELVSEAVCASLRATDPRPGAQRPRRAGAPRRAPSACRASSARSGSCSRPRSSAPPPRSGELRAEEAWERHLLEGDDETMQEMKDAQRRAKKYEARMMDKLALLAVTEEEETEARAAAVAPAAAPNADADDRQQAALEELQKRRQAHEAAAAARRALEARRAAKAAYKTAWDSLQHTMNAYAAAAPFVGLNLAFAAFPWPLFSGARGVGDITRDKVLEFVYERASDGREETDEAARRALVRAALKVWAPAGDRFAARVLRHVEPASRDAVLEGHALVVRILNGELARLG